LPYEWTSTRTSSAQVSTSRKDLQMTIIDRRFVPFALAMTATAVLMMGCSGGGGGGGGPADPQFGTVSGSVLAGGTGVAGATVSVAGGGSAVTGANGAFTIPSVPAGTRTVSLALPAGFITAAAADATSKSVSVAANGTAQASFALKRGVVVTASGTSFSPAAVAVPQGATVRWVNGGGVHTVTPDNAGQAGAWAGSDLGAGASFEHTFSTAGAFNYHCIPHQGMGMTGTITVS
jgi:plastocyanin